MNNFHVSKAGYVADTFKKHFNLRFSNFSEPFNEVIGPYVKVDIFKLDAYFMETFNYEGSMSDFVTKQYGEEANKFLKQLL